MVKKGLSVQLDSSVADIITVPKPKKPKAIKYMTTLEALNAKLAEIGDIENLKKPWMSSKVFSLITTGNQLQDWVNFTLNNVQAHRTIDGLEGLYPVVALDTETTGLDTRIVNGKRNVEIAGLCLCSDGVEGLYIPVTHPGPCIKREDINAILQPLFNKALLAFFNAKYDREIMRITMGTDFKPFPWFEDVQIFSYLLDPKADFGKMAGMNQGGLKALSKRELNIEQIELDELVKVKVNGKMVHAPFNLLPSETALWYAAGDAITTWLLWDKYHKRARRLANKEVPGTIKPNEIDHELVDTIAWMERQRFPINVDHLKRTSKWHSEKLEELRKKLADMTGNPDFNPGSTDQLADYLFKVKGFKPYKLSKKTDKPSTDAESLEELRKQHPKDEFIAALFDFREYVALHPDSLTYDPRDNTARIHLRQTTVAGGRMSANGGKFEQDGGCGLNFQAIKSVTGNKWAKGRLLKEDIEEIDIESLPELSLSEINPAFLEEVKVKTPNPAFLKPLPEFTTEEVEATNKINEGVPEFIESTILQIHHKIKDKVIKNHIVSILGYTYCLAKDSCEHCKNHHKIWKENAKADLNEIINLRSLFVAPEGWTVFSVDFSNVEMRCATNISKEPKFMKEFLEGEGDFHTLTATAVFGKAFTDEPDKGKRKALRSLAKILNFALLYGGTEYTIFESLKKEDPTITLERAREMVDAYWDSVATFKKWVTRQSKIAQEDLYTETATGRIIPFESAMVQSGIHEPKAREKEAFFEYKRLKKQVDKWNESIENAEAYGLDADEVAELQTKATRMSKTVFALYRDKTNGIANYENYNKFISKAARLSMNIPLQGLAGDMMRISLNNIRKFVVENDLEPVVRIYASVHDEVDFAIKNEWVPFVLPRIVRCMKLRDMHKAYGWEVPLETDTEYGQSWNIEYHLTGDKDHTPSAWFDVPGMDTYVPYAWSEVYESYASILDQDTSKLPKVVSRLRKETNPRVSNVIDLLEKSKGADIKRNLLKVFQLDEFWNIDEGDESVNLKFYEKHYNLTRPELPYGFGDPLPMEEVLATAEELQAELEARHCTVEVVTKDLGALKTYCELNKEVIENRPELEEDEDEPNPTDSQKVVDAAKQFVETVMEFTGVKPTPSPSVEDEEDDDPFYTPTKPPQKMVEPTPEPDASPEKVAPNKPEWIVAPNIPVLRFLNKVEAKAFRRQLGRGSKTVYVIYGGVIFEIAGVAADVIPSEYCVNPEQIEVENEAVTDAKGFIISED